jgi:hypothetical protein
MASDRARLRLGDGQDEGDVALRFESGIPAEKLRG